MKYAVCSALILLGAIEICYGTFLGRIMIIPREISFSRALNLTPDKYSVMLEYFHRFRGNWGILTIFGITNIIISVKILTSISSSKSKVCYALLILGVIKILFGNYIGGMLITAEEASFAQALDLHPYKYQIMKESLDVFRDDWSVVSLFGILNIFISIIFFKYYSNKPKISPNT